MALFHARICLCSEYKSRCRLESRGTLGHFWFRSTHHGNHTDCQDECQKNGNKNFHWECSLSKNAFSLRKRLNIFLNSHQSSRFSCQTTGMKTVKTNICV